MLEQARYRAKRDGVPCTITVDDFDIPLMCPVLGIRLAVAEGTNTRRSASPSLDRYVPADGYIPGGVEVISNRANTIKNDATLEELEAVTAYARRIAQPRH